jgi:hypothetical protein
VERLGDVEEATQRIRDEIAPLLSKIRHLIAPDPLSVAEGVSLLGSFRREIYESLNQIQHEYLVLEAIKWLERSAIALPGITWYWNPRQTGTFDEPDLSGRIGEVQTLACEITTSENPIGTIDLGMAATLRKLAAIQGAKFYFVRTAAMLRRAETKVAKAGWPIKVASLEGRKDSA